MSHYFLSWNQSPHTLLDWFAFITKTKTTTSHLRHHHPADTSQTSRAFDEEFETANQKNQDSEDETDFVIDNQELPVFDETRTVPEVGGSKSFGKEKLEEDEPVRGNPARETVELICGDVDFLVQLRNKVMQEVVEFFHSFSLNKLTDLDGLKALKAKESLMLNWAETDSLEMAVRRRVYILAKYREMLLRKFLESHRKYIVTGQPWTSTASKIIDLLSVAHSKSLEDLIAQQKAQGLPIEQPCTSTVLDTSVGSGAVLAQFYSMAKSTCWVTPLFLIDGVWTPIQGNELLRSSCKLSLFVNRKKIPKSVVEEAFVPHCYLIEPVQYWGAAPSLIKTWGWARVCTEIIRYSMFGCLRPVCREIVVL
ncbi:centromere/kinetochore protein zw10 [Dorcoceras hygrometricum]|uniref:Centromere/kinetochore protein zw10 n=1 Tax=Dorcoceras hygrometricum TaxID=472368 RepID=A0A2Z7BRJ3_9LAMI|nr:centromere/kinetochore protein zw10 [Dorcoceras hygrometricum]